MGAAPRASIDRLLSTGWRLREVDPALGDADNFADENRREALTLRCLDTLQDPAP